MVQATLGDVLQYLRITCDTSQAADLTDGDLIERFLVQRQDWAFAVLMQRHGPMVLGVCRRVLGDADGADDCFQATFVILVRRAAAIKKKASLGPWLHGVAHRVAVRARVQAARRQSRERKAQVMPCAGPLDELTWRELRSILDEEIGRLAEKYRAPLVLVHLEGKSYRQAAEELGWARGTLVNRAARGRQLLRQQLQRRGIALSAASLAVVLEEKAAGAMVSAQLTINTGLAATKLTAGATLSATCLSTRASALAEQTLPSMACAPTKKAVVLGLAVLLAIGMISFAFHQAGAAKLPIEQLANDSSRDAGKIATAQAVDLFGDPIPSGAVARLGTIRWRHGGGVGFAAFMPDGKRVLSVGNDRAIHLWEYPSGKELLRFGQPAADNAVDWKAGESWRFCDHAKFALTRDGKTLAVSVDGDIKVYESETGKVLRKLVTDLSSENAPALAFSPDGQTLAALQDATTIRMWDWAQSREIRQLGGPERARSPRFRRNLAPTFSPDGKSIAATLKQGVDGVVTKIWDTGTGKELQSLPGHRLLNYDEAFAPVFSPDSKFLACLLNPRVITLLECATAKPVRSLNRNEVTCWLMFTPDGGTIYTRNSYEHLFSAWDVASGKKIRTIGQHIGNNPHLSNEASRSICMSISPDGKTAAVADGWRAGCHRLSFLDLDSGKRIVDSEGPAQPLLCIHFTPDGKHVIAQGDMGTVESWDTTTAKRVAMHSLAEKEFTWINDVNPDGAIAATQSVPDPGISLYDLTANKEVGRIPSPGDQGRCFFSPDGKTLAVIWPNTQQLEWFDIATCKRLHGFNIRRFDSNRGILHTDKRAPETMIFSPDSKMLAAYTDPDTFAWWDVATGKRLGTLRPPEGTAFQSGAFTADGRGLVVDAADGTAILFELATGKARRVFGKKITPAPTWGGRMDLSSVRMFPCGDASKRVALSPDGKILAHADHERKVRLYDLLSGRALQAFAGHSGSILAIAFSPDGRTIASASADTTVLLWDVAAAR
jgi:RNA polymerase sigma factor (sigma-70 family)